MLRIFLQFELEKIRKYFRVTTTAKVITSILFFIVFLFVGVGIYKFFVSGFRYINVDVLEEMRIPLTLLLYELFLLVLGGIILFSSMVSGIFTLFRGKNDNWILSTPKYKVFPNIIFIKGLMTSVLPLLVMFLPAVLALGKVYTLPFIGFICIVLSVVLFFISINALILIGIIALGFVYYHISRFLPKIRFTFKGLVILLLLSVVGIITLVWKNVSNIDFIQLFKADDINATVTVSDIGRHFAFLPSHPFALEIINWQNNLQGNALLDLLILFVITLMLLFVWSLISPLFYVLWQKFQEGGASRDMQHGFFNKHAITYSFNGGTTMALFKKEFLISSRNTKGVLWFLFLLFIWLAQIGANVIMNHNIQRYQPDMSQKTIMLQVMQFIIAVYFIASFTLRFVFTSFSTEKKTSWILASAPLSFTKIFFGKYALYTSFFVIIGICMSYINSSILNVPYTYALYSMLLLVSVIIFIVTLGLSLGALFPNTETDDPEIISTSMPGLIFTALTLLYGALSDWILHLVLQEGAVLLLIGFLIITYAVIGFMIITTLRRVGHQKSYF